ncbi:hypothetical protein [Streptomyces sp. NPDC087297]
MKTWKILCDCRLRATAYFEIVTIVRSRVKGLLSMIKYKLARFQAR